MEETMRNEILRMLENNSRIDLHDLAIMLGTDDSVVLQEICLLYTSDAADE